jgi:hypothetical protein
LRVFEGNSFLNIILFLQIKLKAAVAVLKKNYTSFGFENI